MQLGGNGPFLSFVESYAPADQGGYKSEMSPHEKYHCWAATQYKSKVRREGAFGSAIAGLTAT